LNEKAAYRPPNGTSTSGGTTAGVTGNAGGVVGVVFGEAGSVLVADLSAYGVAQVYAVELDRYAPLAWARVLASLSAEVSATAVVAAGTDRGHEVMAHLGAITGLPLAANCVSAQPDEDGTLRLVRHRWAGSLLEDAVLEDAVLEDAVLEDAVLEDAVLEDAVLEGASAALLTVAVDAVPAVPAGRPTPAAVRAYQPAFGEADLLVRAIESAGRAGGASLATARVVVGGGRGVGGPDGFGVLEELAGLLGGVVGVSRVVTSEGWRPHQQQVGQTGTRISPELYLACGISGAIQHMAGCLSAKHIVAVNTDAEAPIIARADYAVIGDLSEVIPALVAAIRARTP
jgi:electron transfer flavoprotein alpha subunit